LHVVCLLNSVGSEFLTSIFSSLTWLRAWAKQSDGLAFLTYNRDVTLILRWLSTSCSKKTQTEFYLLIVLAGNLQSQNLAIGILWFVPINPLTYF